MTESSTISSTNNKMMRNSSTSDTSQRRFLILLAWAVMLLVSDLPNIVWDRLINGEPSWLLWGKVGLLIIFFMLCLVWKKIRPLLQYAAIFLVFYLSFVVSLSVRATNLWKGWFGGSYPSFTLEYLGAFIPDLGIAFVVIVALWIMKRRRSEFFLTKGQLNAPIEPIRWLRIGEGESWRTFGWIFALVAGLGILIVVILSVNPSLEILYRIAPLLPSVVLFAAINAFTEKVYFRVSFLSTLHKVIGKRHSLLITAVFFGLSHYLYGSPSGLPGFLMIGFLGWLLGKSILETKGLFWAWFIHFVPDVIIFASYTIN